MRTQDGQQTPGDNPREGHGTLLSSQPRNKATVKISKMRGSQAEKWGCTACRGSNQRVEPNIQGRARHVESGGAQ
eukprot:358361-Chlamydomonas_euryale.AAC.2